MHGSLLEYLHEVMDVAAAVHHMGDLMILKAKWEKVRSTLHYNVLGTFRPIDIGRVV